MLLLPMGGSYFCQKKIWLRFVCQHAKQDAKLFVFVFV
jgi:hypothetical protein